MKRRTFIKQSALLGLTTQMVTQKFHDMIKPVRIQLLRHATLVIHMDGATFLVDPMFSVMNEMDPVQNCGNDIRIPMVDMPVSNVGLNKILGESDAILVTHTHRDHWDMAAQKMIDKQKPIFCQPSDLEKIKSQGFIRVTAVDASTTWKGITIHRTTGQHGTGEIGKKMGEVSGFVLKGKNTTVYVAGDTIWCDDVDHALSTFKPDVTILNTGGARFLTGDPITMTPQDVMMVNKKMPKTKIVAVHMDTVNHCLVTRKNLSDAMVDNDVEIAIPGDGEILEFAS